MLYQKNRSDSLGFLRDISGEQYDFIQEMGWRARNGFGCGMDLYDVVDIDGTQDACIGESINPIIYALADTMFKRGDWKIEYCSDRTTAIICDLMDAKPGGWRAPAFRAMKNWVRSIYDLPDDESWPEQLARRWMYTDYFVNTRVSADELYFCDETSGAYAVLYFNSQCKASDVFRFLEVIGCDPTDVIRYRDGWITWMTCLESYEEALITLAMDDTCKQMIQILKEYPDRRPVTTHVNAVVRIFYTEVDSLSDNERFIHDCMNTYRTNEMVIL